MRKSCEKIAQKRSKLISWRVPLGRKNNFQILGWAQQETNVCDVSNLEIENRKPQSWSNWSKFLKRFAAAKRKGNSRFDSQMNGFQFLENNFHINLNKLCNPSALVKYIGAVKTGFSALRFSQFSGHKFRKTAHKIYLTMISRQRQKKKNKLWRTKIKNT